MLSFTFVATAALLFLGASADYFIDPTTVPLATRSKWCEAQISSCPLLCTQFPGGSSTTAANTCDPKTLQYYCICGNGLSPNASQYSQTIPYFECVEWGQNCVASCGANNNICAASCLQNNPCGAQNPIRVNVTSTSSTMSTAAATADSASTSATGGVVYTGYGGSAATATPTPDVKNGAQTVLDLGRSYGLSLVILGLFSGFALMI